MVIKNPLRLRVAGATGGSPFSDPPFLPPGCGRSAALSCPLPHDFNDEQAREDSKRTDPDRHGRIRRGRGDTVKVNTRVIEGGKERIQAFSGIVIGIKGAGAGKSFTVRKISYGEGVERVFPFHTPRIASVEVTKRGRVRRAKLNYLRKRIGKEAVQVKETAGH
jgi:large subunit ribosomal protein L19